MTEGKRGPAFYDDNSVFRTYMDRRARPQNPNDTVEGPVFKELVGTVAGLRVLDLGCGAAQYGRELLAGGASSYLGLDGSENMVREAEKALAGTPGQVRLTDLIAWNPEGEHDLVVSRLVIHYIEDLGALFGKVCAALRPGGRFVFSAEHPVITSCNRALDGGGLRQEWIVDDYFVTGERIVDWMGGRVVVYHHTVEDFYGALLGAGFMIEALREGRPSRENFEHEPTYQRRLRIPLFLIMAARKPA